MTQRRPSGVGGFHVRAQVAASADPLGVPAAVPAHQVPYRLFELGVVQRVQLLQPVAQTLRTDSFPSGLLLPVAGARQHGEHQCDEEHPPVGQYASHAPKAPTG
ncbi:hypothetical protein GCM10010255_81130 [Streptomyces coeruleofuscus]|uniref:Uncharacterized protein n=1 Tax=Streptomyces coeruleofuscus TaxID=66879 RepID=A0ABP5WG88_9ACTN